MNTLAMIPPSGESTLSKPKVSEIPKSWTEIDPSGRILVLIPLIPGFTQKENKEIFEFPETIRWNWNPNN